MALGLFAAELEPGGSRRKNPEQGVVVLPACPPKSAPGLRWKSYRRRAGSCGSCSGWWPASASAETRAYLASDRTEV